MPPTLTEIQAIQAVCEYLHNDEQAHWEEDGKPTEHIYQSVRILERYLTQTIKP